MVTSLPPVSIGIPFFNAERFLLDAIKSVFAQTHEDWELILMDDGSTDSSLEIAQSIKDSRVRVYSDGDNKRLAARLNEIHAISRFEYVARMDADDLMMPERISRLLTLLQDNPRYDLASCGAYSVDASLNLIGMRGEAVSDFTLDGLLQKSQRFLHAGLVARRSWFQRNKYNESLFAAEDAELWHRAAKGGDFKAVSIPDPLYVYREEGNVTKKKLSAAYRVERTHISKLIDRPPHRFSYLAKSWGKSATVAALDAVGGLRYLLQRRQEGGLSLEALSEYKAGRDAVLRVSLPYVSDD